MRELFVEQMHGVLKEDLDVYEAQQRAIDMDPEAPNRDANPRGTIPADEGPAGDAPGDPAHVRRRAAGAAGGGVRV